MNKNILDLSLQTLINNQSVPENKVFVQLLRQVWQIDWSVPAYDIWGHFIEYDVTYFLRFMQADAHDEGEEKQLIIEWISLRLQNYRPDTSLLIHLLDEINILRVEASKG